MLLSLQVTKSSLRRWAKWRGCSWRTSTSCVRSTSRWRRWRRTGSVCPPGPRPRSPSSSRHSTRTLAHVTSTLWQYDPKPGKVINLDKNLDKKGHKFGYIWINNVQTWCLRVPIFQTSNMVQMPTDIYLLRRRYANRGRTKLTIWSIQSAKILRSCDGDQRKCYAEISAMRHSVLCNWISAMQHFPLIGVTWAQHFALWIELWKKQ